MYNIFCIETDIPVLLFEDDGSLVYSPVSKIRNQCSEMERRINEMKEKRENLSPTGKNLNFIYSCAYTNGRHFYCCTFCHTFSAVSQNYSYCTFLEIFNYLDSEWKYLNRIV